VATVTLDRPEAMNSFNQAIAAIAARPPAAVQGTVRAIWESLDSSRTQALRTGLSYTQIGNPIGTAELDRATLTRPEWRLR
jgi:enoyl-CoA hydratase/carnithine racemase